MNKYLLHLYLVSGVLSDREIGREVEIEANDVRVLTRSGYKWGKMAPVARTPVVRVPPPLPQKERETVWARVVYL